MLWETRLDGVGWGGSTGLHKLLFPAKTLSLLALFQSKPSTRPLVALVLQRQRGLQAGRRGYQPETEQGPGNNQNRGIAEGVAREAH